MPAADMQRTHYGRYTRLATFNSVRQNTAYEVSDFEACDNIPGEGYAEASLSTVSVSAMKTMHSNILSALALGMTLAAAVPSQAQTDKDSVYIYYSSFGFR